MSWLGNSLPGGEQWIQQDIAAMCVTGDGTVYTNVEWDEGGGQVGAYREGRLLGYAKHTHGWGQLGGQAIAVNSQHVFIAMLMHNEGGGLKDSETWPPKGKKWYGVSRRLRADFTRPAPFTGGKGGKGDTLKGCFLPVVEVDEKSDAPLTGLAVTESQLFVANPHAGRIEVFDAATLQKQTDWRVERPGPLAIDKAGVLWVLRRSGNDTPAQLLRFRPNGDPIEPGIDLPREVDAVAFCFEPGGRLLLADDGPAQQIHVMDVARGPANMAGALGRRGGIDAGRPGEFADLKFNRPKAVGCDAAGNLFVAHSGSSGGGSTVLESYAVDWAQVKAASEAKPLAARLNWRLFGLLFVDMADVDPADDANVFTKEERFHMDYGKPRGSEWSYAGYTIQRLKYPQDPRLHLWSAGAWVRRIEGKRFLFVTDMYSEYLQVYRFAPETDGETAIPGGLFAKRRIRAPKSLDWPPHQPERGEWIWRDTNGNGAFDPGEFTSRGGADCPEALGWWVDAQGNVWLATRRDGIRMFPVQGLDSQGNPIWDYRTMRVGPRPAEFESVRRLRYDAGTDTLFLGGTTNEHKNQHWKPMGPVLARYDDWLRGSPTLKWRMVAPYEVGSQGHFSCEPMGFDVAGQYLFVPYTGASKAMGYSTGHIEVFRASDGASVGHMEPSADIGEIGLQDIPETLRAHRRADGEYLIFLEEDAKAKVLMFRWRPE